MIQKVIISGLKNIKHEEMTLKPLTLLTGLNSTGKSSVLQAILLVNKATTKMDKYIWILYFLLSPPLEIYMRMQKSFHQSGNK